MIINILSEKFQVFQILNYATGVSSAVLEPRIATSGFEITEKKIPRRQTEHTAVKHEDNKLLTAPCQAEMKETAHGEQLGLSKTNCETKS